MQNAFKNKKTIFKWLVFAFLLFFLVYYFAPLKILFVQIFTALLLCLPLYPFVNALEKKFSPALSAFIALFCLLLCLLLLLFLVVPPLIIQISSIIRDLPTLLSSIKHFFLNMKDVPFIEKIYTLSSFDQLSPEIVIDKTSQFAFEQAPKFFSSFRSIVEGVSRAFLSPVLAFYFLKDRKAFSFKLSLLIPLKYRKKALVTLKNMQREALYFVRGQLLIAFCVFLLTAFGLLIVGLPTWLALGLIMGVCELIPYVGPLIGALPILLFSLPLGLQTTFFALLVTFIVQQLEASVISPRLMGGATGLHPVYVLLLLTFGGLVAGILGMVITLPLFLALRAALRNAYDAKEDIPALLLQKNKKNG